MNTDQQQVWDALSKPEQHRGIRTIKPDWTVSVMSSTGSGIHPYYDKLVARAAKSISDEIDAELLARLING